VTIDVVRPDELGAQELAAWSRIQQSDSELGSPFLSPQFALACARVRSRTRVAVLSGDEGITGFLPLELGRAGFGRALGQGFSDVQGLVASRTADIDARALLRACGLRTWQFDHLLGTQARWLSDAPHRWVEDRSPVVDLSEGWDAYEKALRASGSLYSTTARRRRALERDHGPVSVTLSEPDHALLEQVLEWKSHQYRRTGRRDVFAEPGMRRLVHDLLDRQDPEFGAPLAVLRAGDDIVAAHLGLRSPGALAWWFPVYVTSFSRFSPGLILCLDILRAMPDQGLQVMDLGKGDEPYKQRLANLESPLLIGAVSRYPVIAGLGAARRWPGETAKKFLHAHPQLRSTARSLRTRVAKTRMGLSSDGPHQESEKGRS
jgi:CelD/BcsL family acetyltransferase involved in cellulose biosynthesis